MKFTTKNLRIRILAFGFLFDFHMNEKNTVVQDVEDTIKEQWFLDAIHDREIDLVLIIGHVAVRSKEYEILFKTIRAVLWDVPIQFFGGHTHIRDYKIYDQKSVALESGRYMETIGFLSIDGIKKQTNSKSPSDSASLKFARRYIDNNLFSLRHHSGTNASTFPTAHGTNVSAMIASAREQLHLDHIHGCAPRDLWLNRVVYPSPSSIFTWLEEDVLPSQIQDSGRTDMPAMVITNTGAIRFDIFEGPFTKDSTFLVSPFTSGFRFVKDVPYTTASKLVQVLNSNDNFQATAAASAGLESWMLAPPEQRSRALSSDHSLRISHEDPENAMQQPLNIASDTQLIPGYTTHDDAGSDGDDTLHSPIKFFRVPNVFSANVGFHDDNEVQGASNAPDIVDVVYNEFIQPWILVALQFLGHEVNEQNTSPYMEGETLTTVMTRWIEQNWKCEG
jgi:hypothetical protein